MKSFIAFLLILCLLFSLCACNSPQSVNLLLFTDNLNALSGEGEISLSDYLIKGSTYRLLMEKDDCALLLVLMENEEGKIKKVRLTLSKTDDTGNIKAVSEKERLHFFKVATDVLSAFTYFEKEDCEALLFSLLPKSKEAFSSSGELTADRENFHLVYYSNKICSQFIISDSFLEKTPVTQKPENKRSSFSALSP